VGLFKNVRGAGGRREGSWGSGGLAAGRLLPREREEGRGRLKEMMLTGGPGLSAGEREGEKGTSWAAAQEGEKERARGGAGLKRPRGEGGGKRISIFFFKHIFQLHFFLQMNF